MGVFLASGPVSRVQVKTARQAQAPGLPGSDPPSRLQRALSSGRSGAGAGSERTRIFSPQTAVVYYTQEKTTSLKTQTRGAEGHCAGCGLRVPSIFPARRGSGAPGSPLQTLTRLQQLLLGSFSLLYFSLVRFFFFLFLKKKLRVWGHHGEGRKGWSPSLLHAGGWTGQFVEEQIGVAGAHLAGGHGCDAGVIESVPFARHWTPAVGCVMAAHGGSGVIGHSIQVVNSVVGVF